jgi:beta-glucanase (GH16 family)
MTQEDIHDLNLKSGMLQSWNQLCFNKNAIFEVSASLPGTSDVGGFWPGVWTMGNLGRAAYGGTTEGELFHIWSDAADVQEPGRKTAPLINPCHADLQIHLRLVRCRNSR